MRNLYRAIAILSILIATLVVSATAFAGEEKTARVYTLEELKCATEALYYEHASSMRQKGPAAEALYAYYLALIAHSLKVRAETTNPYDRNDWGGPDLCEVIAKRIGKWPQYEYKLYPHPVPVTEKPWSVLKDLLGGILHTQTKVPLSEPPVAEGEIIIDDKGVVFVKDLWERAERAAYAVFRNGWHPIGELALADTYWHKCLLSDFRPADPEKCGRLKLAKDDSLCWLKLEQVIIPGQKLMHGLAKHVFLRRVTPVEKMAMLAGEPPPECKNSPKMVEKIHSAWKEWLPKEKYAEIHKEEVQDADAQLLQKQHAPRPAEKSSKKQKNKSRG